MDLLSFLLLHEKPRFYRVEVAETLFGDYAVSRAWGPRGRTGRQRSVWFSNLRDAVVAADTWRRQAMQRGYAPSEPTERTAA
ncbi:MAG: WGR domain-containing protein [Paracoccaceae bacterium]